METVYGQYRFGVSSKVRSYTEEEYASLNGDMKKHTFTVSSPTNDPIYLLIEPDTLCRVKIVPDSDSELQYTLYKNPDASAGTDIVNENVNLVTDNQPTVAAISEDPAITDTGTEIVDLQLSGTADGPGATESGQPSDIAEDVTGWIVDENIPLLVEIVPNDANYASVVFNTTKLNHRV